MCWRGKNIKKKAVEDIHVFKIGTYVDETCATSYFQRFLYEVGGKYRSEIVLKRNAGDRITINEGLHSYSFFKTAIAGTKNSLIVRSGLDYLETYPTTTFGVELAKIYCTIPKGAIYFENEFGEIVSNELVIDRIKKLSNGIE